MEFDKSLIVFESNPDFADNPRGFYEYIIKNTGYKTFWVIEDDEILNALKKRGVNCAKKNSDEAQRVIEKAKYLISSSFYFAYHKKRGQIHISAWHGFPLKVIGFFDSASANPKEFEDLKVITTQSDIVTATSRFSHLTLSGMFAMDPRKVYETGYPRNDIMFYVDAKKELSKLIDIDLKKSKLFFYLPTMRKGLKEEGKQFDENIFNFVDYDCDGLDEFLEAHNTYIVEKLHFADMQLIKLEEKKIPKRIIFLDSELMGKQLLTIYHIMDAFDGLITDYSSVYADFMLLNKPIIFSCPDLEKYQEDRGFVVDDPRLLMPGPVVKTQNELTSVIGNLLNGKDEYKKHRQYLMPFFHKNLDGYSSKRLLHIIENDLEVNNDINKNYSYLYDDCMSPLSQYLSSYYTYELYYDDGNGFSEDKKITGKYEIQKFENVHINLYIKLPRVDIKQLRFDPSINGGIVIKDFKAVIEDKELKIEAIINGIINNGDILFNEHDPQILFNILDCIQSNYTVEISFTVCTTFSEEGERIISKAYKENTDSKKRFKGLFKRQK